MDHTTLQTNHLEETKDFFCEVLELYVGDRPPFDFPGYWLYNQTDEHPIIHVIGREEKISNDTGTLHHLAYLGDPDRYDEFDTRISVMEWAQDRRIVPASGIRQIFVTGPHNILVELNFPETA